MRDPEEKARFRGNDKLYGEGWDRVYGKKEKCLICGREMTKEEDWGGDCVDCMANVGDDPDAIEFIKKRDGNK